MLKVSGLTKAFGGLKALTSFSVDVAEDAIVGIIGPNGAGKTTAFNCISGFIRPDNGSVLFEGSNITAMKPSKICKLGLARTFQIVEPFMDLTVIENVIVGAFCWESSKHSAKKYAVQIIETLGLSHKVDFKPNDLTIADKKRLELARALATRPKLLMLDEVMAGLNPTETKEMIEVIKGINGEGVTVLLIEHVMKAVMSLCQHIVVLEKGIKIAEGPPDYVASHQEVINAYLGGETYENVARG